MGLEEERPSWEYLRLLPGMCGWLLLTSSAPHARCQGKSHLWSVGQTYSGSCWKNALYLGPHLAVWVLQLSQSIFFFQEVVQVDNCPLRWWLCLSFPGAVSRVFSGFLVCTRAHWTGFINGVLQDPGPILMQHLGGSPEGGILAAWLEKVLKIEVGP
jgi:hypothetical protein